MVCPNCGKEIRNGLTFCPSCGEELGARINVEPVHIDQPQNNQIDIEIETDSTSNKGRSSLTQNSMGQSTYDNTEKKLYQKTWFVILMLVFFWPVGLFLMWKYVNWNKVIKIIITVFCAISLIYYAIGGSDNKASTQESVTTTETAEEQASEESAEKVYFEKDELDNQLIGDLIAAGMKVENIEDGNIRTKCYCKIDGCFTEIIDTLDANTEYNISVSIHAGTTEDELNHMIDTSKKVAKVLDPSLSEDEINSYFERIVSGEVSNDDDHRLNETINIKYSPFVYGDYDGWVRLDSFIYNMR